MAKTTKKILTISVAAYNLENLIQDNLSSFSSLDPKILSKVEVLVINDGSADRTPEIVNEYVKKYPDSFKLINQKNQGAGSTVNTGLKNAAGKYFKMVDGDDWVETETLNHLIPELEKTESDLILTDIYTYNDAKKKIVDRSGYDIDARRELDFSDISDSVDIQMHNAMFKTELLKKNKIKLDNGFYTDIEYVLLPIPYVKTVTYFDAPLYVYRVQRKGQSISKESMCKNYKQHFIVLKREIDDFNAKKNKMPEPNREYLGRAIARLANTELRFELVCDKKGQEIKDYFCFIKEKGGEEIYKEFIKGRKAWILKATDFRALNLLKKLVNQKIA